MTEAQKYLEDLFPGEENRQTRNRLKLLFESDVIRKVQGNCDINKVCSSLKDYTDWNDSLVEEFVVAIYKVLGKKQCIPVKKEKVRQRQEPQKKVLGKEQCIPVKKEKIEKEESENIEDVDSIEELNKLAKSLGYDENDEWERRCKIRKIVYTVFALLLIGAFVFGTLFLRNIGFEWWYTPVFFLAAIFLVWIDCMLVDNGPLLDDYTCMIILGCLYFLIMLIKQVSFFFSKFSSSYSTFFAFLFALFRGIFRVIIRIFSMIFAYGFWGNNEYFLANMIFYCFALYSLIIIIRNEV